MLILGSTGSIGTQALDVIRANPEKFQVVGLAAGGGQVDLLAAQAKEFGVPAGAVAVADSSAAAKVSALLGGEVLAGGEAAANLVQEVSADVVLNALVGSLGLAATLAVIESGATLALANKESLVAGGRLVLDKAKPGQIIPVDSEHSAMAQCLRSGRRDEVARFVLTASGGPFRGQTREEMWDVTPQQAAAHPTWNMGQMNTLNSATLVNKGLELIEACLIFDLDPDEIDVTVHPQSIIHSMVTFTDGATIAQASPPSMTLPIALALDWPRRVAEAGPALDFSTAFSWDFEPVDNVAFPAVELARRVVRQGNTWPAVYNAANEQAAAAFLAGKIHFPEIVDVVAYTMDSPDIDAVPPTSFAKVLEVEAIARAVADRRIAELAVN